jgi:DNA repair ATPase RecN|tara:strand:+ start:1007 stop:1297 length:291 start_codon:yes stop_codon:yes gene_type:complete
MHIIEIVLDGFKSYATRTVISGFDSQFNAITGLNGSGKSNVLDSICFVLGISNLSQVCEGGRARLGVGAARPIPTSAPAQLLSPSGASEQPERAHL